MNLACLPPIPVGWLGRVLCFQHTTRPFDNYNCSNILQLHYITLSRLSKFVFLGPRFLPVDCAWAM
jgi:hypothetical protein